MNYPKVSVIMPIYNSAKYLRDCLNSLIKQTLRDVEIICIDDGSFDDSWNILSEFNDCDGRFRIFHQENEGSAKARNEGLKISKGKYVIFLDSDDLFEPDMLEKMYNKAEEMSCDMAICNYDFISSKSFSNYVMQSRVGKKTDVLDLVGLPLSGLFKFLDAAPWTKLIRREFLLDNNIVFQNLKSANDVYFSYMAGLLAESMCHIDDVSPKVHYRTNTSGQISARRTVYDVYAAFHKLCEDASARKLGLNKIKYVYVAALYYFAFSLLSGRGGDEEAKKNFFTFFQEEGWCAFGENFRSADLDEFKEPLSFFLYGTYDSALLSQMYGVLLDFDECKKNRLRLDVVNKKTVFWGVGAYGMGVLSECNKFNIHFSFVCDSNHIGESAYGYTVASFSDVKENVDCIYVSSNKFFYSICDTIKSVVTKAVPVVNLGYFISNDCDIDDCLVYVGAF